MFVDVQAFFFDTCRDAKPMNDVKSFEHDESHSGCPATYDKCAE